MTFQETIALRLAERDARERAHDEIIANYQRLAKHASLLQSRNNSMMKTSEAPQGMPVSSSTATITPADFASHLESTATPTDSNLSRQAYIKSLESQLATTREELSQLYKTQSQNAQRLLLLNEQMREKEESKQSETLELKTLREDRDKATRRERDLRDAAGEKDRVIEMLQDELRTLSLELNQVEARNDDLKRDNASLLQRWLDRARDEADKVNEANKFLEEIQQRKGGQSGGGSQDGPSL